MPIASSRLLATSVPLALVPIGGSHGLLPLGFDDLLEQLKRTQGNTYLTFTSLLKDMKKDTDG